MEHIWSLCLGARRGQLTAKSLSPRVLSVLRAKLLTVCPNIRPF